MRLEGAAFACLQGWRGASFSDDEDRIGGAQLNEDLFALVRHLAQNDKQSPRFFAFDARLEHDLDAVAQGCIDKNLSRVQEDGALFGEYQRADRYWRVLYPTYHLFRSHYDGCVSRILDALRHGREPDGHRPKVVTSERLPDREPDQAVKDQVHARDGNRCLCCGYTRRSMLQVDHIDPHYLGGLHDMNNLQTLCKQCNGAKLIKQISFRNHGTSLTMTPGSFPDPPAPRGEQARDKERWEMYLRRVVNLFYHCAAVREVVLGARGDKLQHWHVSLFSGNDPRWLEPHKPALLRKIQEARRVAGYTVAPLDMTFSN